MPYYKVTSLTNKLAKRHVYRDKSLKIKYQIGLLTKVYELAAGSQMVISCNNLPVDLHKFRAKKFVIITKIDEVQYNRLQKPSAKPIPVKQEVVTEVEEEKVEPTTTTKKPTTRKSTKKNTTQKKEDEKS